MPLKWYIRYILTFKVKALSREEFFNASLVKKFSLPTTDYKQSLSKNDIFIMILLF